MTLNVRMARSYMREARPEWGQVLDEALRLRTAWVDAFDFSDLVSYLTDEEKAAWDAYAAHMTRFGLTPADVLDWAEKKALAAAGVVTHGVGR